MTTKTASDQGIGWSLGDLVVARGGGRRDTAGGPPDPPTLDGTAPCPDDANAPSSRAGRCVRVIWREVRTISATRLGDGSFGSRKRTFRWPVEVRFCDLGVPVRLRVARTHRSREGKVRSRHLGARCGSDTRVGGGPSGSRRSTGVRPESVRSCDSERAERCLGSGSWVGSGGRAHGGTTEEPTRSDADRGAGRERSRVLTRGAAQPDRPVGDRTPRGAFRVAGELAAPALRLTTRHPLRPEIPRTPGRSARIRPAFAGSPAFAVRCGAR